MRRERRLALVAAAVASVVAMPTTAGAQDEVSISIANHAGLTSDGAVIITVRVACDPPPGTEEFREALAGARQARTGAEAEGEIGGTVVCDGTPRTHTARLSPFTDAVFKRGPAVASASLLVCNVVGEDQVCVHGAAQRRIIIRGPAIR